MKFRDEDATPSSMFLEFSTPRRVAVTDIAAALNKIPASLRQQLRDRISEINMEQTVSIPGVKAPPGSRIGGYYEPATGALHVSTVMHADHVVMHEVMHALDKDLQAEHSYSAHRYSGMSRWMTLCVDVWRGSGPEVSKYFKPDPDRRVDRYRAARETFAELAADYFEGRPLSLDQLMAKPLPPALAREVRDHLDKLFSQAKAVQSAAEPPDVPLCVGMIHDDGAVEFVSVVPSLPTGRH